MGNNITKLKSFFLHLIDILASLGETTQYLLVGIFKGYGACIYNSFVKYI